jgi:hypothetical protein
MLSIFFVLLLTFQMMHGTNEKVLADRQSSLDSETKNDVLSNTEQIKKKVLRYFSENKNVTVEQVMHHFKEKKEIDLDLKTVTSWLDYAKQHQKVSKSLDLKYDVVKFAEKNPLMTNAEIAKRFSSVSLEVTKHNVKDWKRAKAEIIKAKEDEGIKGSVEKVKHSTNLKLEMALKNWFLNMRKNLPKVPINGAVLKTKSESLAKLLGQSSGFTAWQIESFCERYKIHSKFIYGSKLGVDVKSALSWLQQNVPEIIEEFGVENVFSADEAAFFFQALPNRTLALDVEDVAGAGKGKLRFTFHACMSMAGEKLQLLVIGFFLFFFFSLYICYCFYH